MLPFCCLGYQLFHDKFMREFDVYPNTASSLSGNFVEFNKNNLPSKEQPQFCWSFRAYLGANFGQESMPTIQARYLRDIEPHQIRPSLFKKDGDLDLHRTKDAVLRVTAVSHIAAETL